MLTLLEKNIQRAALHGNYETYLAAYKQWEALQEQPIPSEKISNLFYRTQLSSPGMMMQRSILTGILAAEDKSPESIKEKSKIVVHILDKLQEANIEIDFRNLPEPLSWNNSSYLQTEQPTQPFFPPKSTIFEWATIHNASTVLNHPLIKKEMVLSTITDSIQAKNAAQVRRAFEYGKKNHQLRTAHLEPLIMDAISSNVVFIANDKARDVFFADLMKHKYVGAEILSTLESHMGMGNNLPLEVTFQNAPKIRETALFKLCNAIDKLSQDPTQQATALALIDDYFNGIDENEKETLATSLMDFCFDRLLINFLPLPTLSPEDKQVQEAVLAKLVVHGASIPPAFFINYIPSNHKLPFLLNNKMLNVLTAKGALKNFKKMWVEDQKIHLQSLFNSIDDNSPQILDLLCKQTHPNLWDRRSDIPHLPADFSCKFTPEELVHQLSKLGTDEKLDKNLIKMVAILLAHDLVDKEKIKPGSHIVGQINPETSALYDLYAFIQDNPLLKKAWDKPRKDEELIELYHLTKALLQGDETSEEVLSQKAAQQQVDSLHRLSWLDMPQRSQPHESDTRKLVNIHKRRKSLAGDSSTIPPEEQPQAGIEKTSFKKKNK